VSRMDARRKNRRAGISFTFWSGTIVTLICLAVLAVVPTETVDDLTKSRERRRLDGDPSWRART